jgi:hypothetical protein
VRIERGNKKEKRKGGKKKGKDGRVRVHSVGVHRFARYALYGRSRQATAHETKSVRLFPYPPPCISFTSFIFQPNTSYISIFSWNNNNKKREANFRSLFAYRLATLFVSPNFKGNYYALNGIYASCYNVLKEGSVGSILLDAVTSHCEIWAVEECGGDSDGMSFHCLLLSKVLSLEGTWLRGKGKVWEG